MDKIRHAERLRSGTDVRGSVTSNLDLGK